MEKYTHIQNIKKAILRGDSAYCGVPLPTPQRAGTYFQQATYANIQAERVFERYLEHKIGNP
ncbi:hypothetical protein [Candidatus Ulvibacter alkanivorans]|uniref:hypothetical protein n=1 Tax=Candidatus Ulvibacter alkanivorans TaxID=2267620 RepID=UPI00109D68CB|nr:hypothetical protein [Candidatus Ulvibacter alkanivorans]